MSLILGMGIWVFLAWILTILAAILCVLYGIYQEFIKKDNDEEKPIEKKKQKPTVRTMKKGAK